MGFVCYLCVCVIIKGGKYTHVCFFSLWRMRSSVFLCSPLAPQSSPNGKNKETQESRDSRDSRVERLSDSTERPTEILSEVQSATARMEHAPRA